MTVLAMDIGQSGGRFVLQDERGRTRRDADVSAVWLDGDEIAQDVAAQLLETALGVGLLPVPESGAPPTILVGLSGFDPGGAAASTLARELGTRSSAASVVVASDVAAWHLAAMDGGAGIVSVLGTGSITLGADGQGACHRVDGWGHLVGDDASGFAVGRAGLAAALRAYDGRDGSTPLLERAVQRYGSAEALVSAIHRSRAPVAAVAGFAVDVADCARAGDPAARSIWASVADQLGSAIIAAHRAVFEHGRLVPVVIDGGLKGAADLMRERLRHALHGFLEGLEATFADLDPLDGVLRLRPESARTFPGLVVAWPS